jgi:hypothetical protein
MTQALTLNPKPVEKPNMVTFAIANACTSPVAPEVTYSMGTLAEGNF